MAVIAGCWNFVPNSPGTRDNMADAYLELGNRLLGQGHVADAAAAYRCAIELRPLAAEAHNNLGTALLQQRQSGRSHRLLAAGAGNQGRLPRSPLQLGVAANAAGKRDEAAAFYRRALELNPQSIESYNNLGNVLRAQDKMDEAIDCWRTALRLKPDCCEARTTLAMMLYGLGRPGRSGGGRAGMD